METKATEERRDWCGRRICDGPIAYVDRTGVDIGPFHAAVMAAIANGGAFTEDFADLLKLSRPAGVWILEMA